MPGSTPGLEFIRASVAPAQHLSPRQRVNFESKGRRMRAGLHVI